MVRPLLRSDRLLEARKAAGMTREDLARTLGLSGPARVRVWELGLERPRPRFVPRLAAALGVEPLHLLDADPQDPSLAALRVAAGLATNEMGAPGLSVMTYARLEDGRPGTEPSPGVVIAVAEVLGVAATRVEAAIRRSRSDHAALASTSD
ncbi:helix-turn-helix transcriptional regulator [Geodermatophilus sp. DSM 44513]|uniref:helix-turn-helix domain-containing protein n=1 Tax=Geodermatophilus sp. DSM 44513 TaxID=1528104 RepID=UPI0014131DE9|nr:helix-turn-helix transcriptional regulator [Geodermatophilus sp. DSM 44513]WNV75298.1 helix-turn-helix transcriptional regulator [Geodermatophilus sp. DSM 44513]